MDCAKCGKPLSWPAYTCQFCKKVFCSKNCQFPEEHNCEALKKLKEETREGFVLRVGKMREKGFIDKNGKYI